MIVRNGAGLRFATRFFLLENWLAIPIIILIEYVVTHRERFLPALGANVFQFESVAMIATVVGIFLGFRFNEAYERWWEARKLWGALVNTSRRWCRQVTLLLTPERVGREATEPELAAARRVLVMRHLAFVNALRLRLRGQEYDESVKRHLRTAEFDELSQAANLPTQLVQQQARDLTSIFGSHAANHLLLNELDSTLDELYDIQGGCERIDSTVFPESVTLVAKILIWGVVLLIPTSFLEPETTTYSIEYVAIFFICLAFLVVNQLATMLQDPFENAPNDTPMTAICTTIEIDLLQQLGESEVPEPVEPVGGVLM